MADIGKVGGLLSTAGLLGWAFGGFLFGIIADYIGRVRTLALSILIFSVFTACQGLSQTPLQLGIFRFLAGVGTGAEIIVGIPLSPRSFAETAPRPDSRRHDDRRRVRHDASAAQVYNLVGPYGWRWVFFVGIVPALLLSVHPPRHGRARAFRRGARAAAGAAEAGRARPATRTSEFMRFVPLQLFNPQNRFSTLVGLLFCVGTLLAIWTSNIWLPTIQRNMLAEGRHHRATPRSPISATA